MGVHVAVAGGGTIVGGANGFKPELGFCKMLKIKKQAQNVINSITRVSRFQVKSGLDFLLFFGAEPALGVSLRKSS